MDVPKIPTPIFTLRGHNVGITSLVHCNVAKDSQYLLSGDEEGSIVIWDLSIFRKIICYSKFLKSRVQSLREVILPINSEDYRIIVAQSRDNGIVLLDFNHAIESANLKHEQPKILASFPTCESLFSRGDARTIAKGKAILAHPSCIENYLVTVRIMGPNVVTLLSGSAQRNTSEKEKKFPVFDIRIESVSSSENDYHLFVAYEDGLLCAYKFSLNSTETVPVLESTGLRIELIRKFDLKIGDFISAFDISFKPEQQGIVAVCGSPHKKLIFLTDALVDDNTSLATTTDLSLENVPLKRQGVSAIRKSPDEKFVAVAGWDSMVRLYSIESRKQLAIQNYHSKQVQDILFVESLDNHQQHQYFLCCASMEGTISISVIY